MIEYANMGLKVIKGYCAAWHIASPWPLPGADCCCHSCGNCQPSVADHPGKMPRLHAIKDCQAPFKFNFNSMESEYAECRLYPAAIEVASVRLSEQLLSSHFGTIPQTNYASEDRSGL